MILGVGNDLTDIRRIEKTIERFGNKFIQRVFTENEIQKAQSRAGAGAKVIASTYAKRFAAKEAMSKALGTGFRNGVYLKDIGVVNAPSGKPTIELTGAAKSRLIGLTPRPYNAIIHLTMTDEYPYAQAFVIISLVMP
jgi:holo-[acyl-carrier protein] synthase